MIIIAIIISLLISASAICQEKCVLRFVVESGTSFATLKAKAGSIDTDLAIFGSPSVKIWDKYEPSAKLWCYP